MTGLGFVLGAVGGAVSQPRMAVQALRNGLEE
jgi:hypothetical protein